MKRADDSSAGGGGDAGGGGGGGSGKRPRTAAEGGQEAMELIDLTTEDSPVAPPRPAAAAASAAAARPVEVVEVDDDDSEGEEEPFGDLFLGSVQSKIVGIQYYTGIVSRHEAVYLVREPENRYDRNAIKAMNVSNEMVGHVPAVLSALLAPIMDAFAETDFRVEGLVPNPDQNVYTMPLILNLRGSERAKARVQQLLAQVPRIGKGHKVLAGGAVGTAGGGKKGGAAAAAGPTVHDIMTKELERLYASSVPYEAMPEARTPRLLRSRLHPHQAKALHWMLNAERELDVAQALAEQRQQQQAVAAAAAMDGGGGAGAAAEGAGAGKGKGKGKKAAAAAAVSSSTVFFYEERVYPASGRTVYYNIATDSATVEPPRLARGGLLCDDMGLGKTIEALALIAADVEERAAAAGGGKGGGGAQGLGAQQQRAPTLVVCPLSVMANWEEQVKEHLKGLEALETDSADAHVKQEVGTGAAKMKKRKGKGLRVAVYHGKDRGALKLQALQTYDIVLTTYHVLARNFKSSSSASSGGSGGKQRTLGSKRKGLLAVPWRRVILDEAHNIRNRASLTAQAAFALEAERRWCLTGTPISNRIEDLFSLVKFLRIEPFSEFSWFQRLIVRPIQDRDAVGFQRLQLLVRHHALRRVKDMKVRVRGPDGAMVLRPLVALPPKMAEMVPLELPPAEREAYDALHALARGLFSLAADGGGGGGGQQRSGSNSTGTYAHIFSILTRLRLLCLHPSLVPPELIEKVKRLHRTAAAAASGAGGAAAVMDPQAAMAKALGDLGKDGVDKLLKALEAKQGESEDCSICLEELGPDGVITRCLHVYHRSCLFNALVAKNPRAANDPRAPGPCPNCRQPVSMGDVLAQAPPEAKAEVVEEEGGSDEEEEEGGKGAGGIKPSGKMAAILARVKQVLGRSPEEGNRLVLFSSFTSFLDLLGAMLTQEGIAYQRLDGSTSREKRAAITRAWGAASASPVGNEEEEEEDGSDDDEEGGGGGRKKGGGGPVQVLLLSIKAGGVGLNLTGASNVVIAEPFFNPAVEDQAIDRVHRIGQTRPVQVTRFILSQTVEQALLRLQDQKRQLVAASFHQSREELRRLNYQMLRSVFDME